MILDHPEQWDQDALTEAPHRPARGGLGHDNCGGSANPTACSIRRIPGRSSIRISLRLGDPWTAQLVLTIRRYLGQVPVTGLAGDEIHDQYDQSSGRRTNTNYEDPLVLLDAGRISVPALMCVASFSTSCLTVPFGSMPEP